jgi:prepilin peptidase CpaA
MSDPFTVDFAVVALFAAILGMALVTDVQSLRIPNRLCAALVLLYPAHLFAGGALVNAPTAVLVALAVLAAGLLPFARGWMGGGDVKLLAATSLWMGPDAILPFLMVTALIGGVLAAMMISRFRFPVVRAAETVGLTEVGDLLMGKAIPFGVAIALAGWIVGGPHLLAQAGVP